MINKMMIDAVKEWAAKEIKTTKEDLFCSGNRSAKYVQARYNAVMELYSQGHIPAHIASGLGMDAGTVLYCIKNKGKAKWT